MPVRATSHFNWQVLRTIKRSRKPPTGRELRLIPNRFTKDGSFLTNLVEAGLLTRATGTPDAPFTATYTLTEKGKYAAEYGEYEYEMPPRLAEPGRRGARLAQKAR